MVASQSPSRTERYTGGTRTRVLADRRAAWCWRSCAQCFPRRGAPTPPRSGSLSLVLPSHDEPGPRGGPGVLAQQPRERTTGVSWICHQGSRRGSKRSPDRARVTAWAPRWCGLTTPMSSCAQRTSGSWYSNPRPEIQACSAILLFSCCQPGPTPPLLARDDPHHRAVQHAEAAAQASGEGRSAGLRESITRHA
jgi:hypothetical protein